MSHKKDTRLISVKEVVSYCPYFLGTQVWANTAGTDKTTHDTAVCSESVQSAIVSLAFTHVLNGYLRFFFLQILH